MDADLSTDYLAGLPESQREELARVNKPGLAALREYLASAEAVAFLGAGASVPLYPLRGTRWAEWLARTGRHESAQALTDENRDICESQHWNADLARCDRVLGRLALAAGDAATASNRLEAAVQCLREGDYLSELAITLADMAECARVAGNLEAADIHATEAIAIAAPRRPVPSHSSGLAARARICADLAAVTTDPEQLYQGRDAAADHAVDDHGSEN